MATAKKDIPQVDIPLDALQLLLDEAENRHPQHVQLLHKHHRKEYSTWMTYLSQGFNVLLYGFGSKRKVLQDFTQRELVAHEYYHCVVIGYDPAASVDQVLRTLATNLNINLRSGQNDVEIADAITKEMDSRPQSEQISVVLVIHNIDGPSFRERLAQTAFSILAANSNFHIIASIDHVNASILWDQMSLSRFRWVWIDATTFASYTKEVVAGESKILGLTSGSTGKKHSIASLESVWASLTNNSKSVFVELVRRCLARRGASITFWELYQGCRAEFFVSNEAGLRHIMIEFTDHHLVVSKRKPDGAEAFTVLVDRKILLKFLNEKGYDDLVPSDIEDEDIENQRNTSPDKEFDGESEED